MIANMFEDVMITNMFEDVMITNMFEDVGQRHQLASKVLPGGDDGW